MPDSVIALVKKYPSLPLWVLMVAGIAADAIGLKATGLSLDPAALRGSVSEFAALIALSLVGRKLKLAAWLVDFLYIAAIIWAYMAITLVMSYIAQAAASGRPFIDLSLSATDHFFGFDWAAFDQWIRKSSSIHTALTLAYGSFAPQMIFVQFLLSWRGQNARSRELALLSVLLCIISIMVSAIWPALDPKADATYIPSILALRDGSMTVIGSRHLEGVVEFPSFHAGMAILYAHAVRGIPDIFPLLIILNALMLAGTLPIGGHYLTDTGAGVILALTLIWGSRSFCKTRYAKFFSIA